MNASKGMRNDIGARNPYAMAEVIAKKKIDWRSLNKKGHKSTLESILGMSYEEMFDPKHDSLLYRDFAKKPGGSAGVKVGDVGVNECGSTPGASYGTNGSWKWTLGTGNDWMDPVQGCCLDCWVIAPLCSIKWALAGSGIPAACTDTTYNLTFYNSSGAALPAVSGSNTLPLNSGNFVFARSRTANEIWPAVYEKAFARSVLGIGPVPPDTDPDHPNLAAIPQGSPYTTLANIKALKCRDGIENFLTSGKTANQVYTDISGKCSLTSGTEGKTIYPMVANTYASGNYSNSTIVANHCYSILGVHSNPIGSPTGTKYIVLRNPFGMTDPQMTGLATGAWPIISSFNFSTNDGIFGLEISQFQTLFERYGWGT